MEIMHKKNTLYYLTVAMIDTATPALFNSGETVSDTAYSKDTSGSWTTLAITDTFSEIGSTGIYEIDLTAAEMNHDKVLIKCTSSGGADTYVKFQMFTQDNDDLATPADVNAEMLDVLTTDTFAEPGQGEPASTETLAGKIGYLYKFLINRTTQTSSILKVYAADESTVDHTATVSDDTTTVERSEFKTGP